MDDYVYDVFISYRRVHPFTVWLKDIFLDDFTSKVSELLGREPLIYWDQQALQPGQAWPLALKEALRQSRCLVPIWTTQYFYSGPCLSEWKTFERRGNGLVVPIQWTESRDQFPSEARAIQMADFSKFAYYGNGFKDSPDFFEMQKAVRKFASPVFAAMQAAPPFNRADERFEPVEVVPPPPPKLRRPSMGVLSVAPAQ